MSEPFVADLPPDDEVCPKCERAVVITSVQYPSTFKTECDLAGCPMNEKYRPKSTGDFGEPPMFMHQIYFAVGDDEEGEETKED